MNTKNNCFSLVIDTHDILNNLDITETRLRDYLVNQDNILFYAFIRHYLDEVTEHFHLVLVLQNSYSKKTIINDIANYFLCNKQLIQCRAVYDLPSIIQYLSHKNDTDKYLYPFTDIQTNDLKTLQTLYNDSCNPFHIDFDYVKYVCIRSNSLFEVFQTLGLANSQRYLTLIKTIWEGVYKERFDYKEVTENVN